MASQPVNRHMYALVRWAQSANVGSVSKLSVSASECVYQHVEEQISLGYTMLSLG